MSTEARLSALEKSVKYHRLGFVAMAMFAACTLLWAHTQPIPEVLRARGFEMIDNKGQVRIKMDITKKGSSIQQFFQPNGKIGISMGANNMGSAIAVGCRSKDIYRFSTKSQFTRSNCVELSSTLAHFSGLHLIENRSNTPSELRLSAHGLYGKPIVNNIVAPTEVYAMWQTRDGAKVVYNGVPEDRQD